MKGQLLHKVFHTLTEAFQNCLRRFPSTVCFVLALTVYLVYLVATDLDDDRKLAGRCVANCTSCSVGSHLLAVP